MSENVGVSRSEVDRLSNEYVARAAALSPLLATFLGLPVGQSELDDLSPSGLAARHELVCHTIEAVTAAPVIGPAQELAREVILERLGLARDRYETGWAHAELNVIDSPVQILRMVFDLTPTETKQDRTAFAARMRALPAALAGYQQSLALAAGRGQVAAVRQIDKCAEQALKFAGRADGPGFFVTAVAGLQETGDLGAELAAAALVAQDGYAELARFLVQELRPIAPTTDAVGLERYTLASREFLGAEISLQDTYDWGWQEFLGIEAELRAVAERIAPGRGPQAAAETLDADPAHQVHGQPALQTWMQKLSDRALIDLGRTHFDIPEAIRRLECRIAPPGGGVGAYYSQPSDDLRRPGRMWWSVETGREVFTTWRETTTVYHEGVPGHHLQLATAVLAREQLNDFQRNLASTSGHCEGWALYAERLVREIGYLDNDGDLLGMLDAQLFRAARVVLDLGLHLELTIPAGTGFHEGETWTPELGLEFLLTRTLADPAHCRDEIDRYLGWPGQAPAYKVGERVWLRGRDAARARHGAAFDEKAFHTAALNLGNMGLDTLTRQLDRI